MRFQIKKIFLVGLFSVASAALVFGPAEARGTETRTRLGVITEVIRCDGPLALITAEDVDEGKVPEGYEGGFAGALFDEDGRRVGTVYHAPFDRPELPAIFKTRYGTRLVHADPGMNVLVDPVTGVMCVNGTGDGESVLIRCGFIPDETASFGYRCNQGVYVFLR